MGGSWGGGGGTGSPVCLWKITKIKGFLAILVQIAWKKTQSYQASIHCWAIFGPPAKRHLNWFSLAGQWCPLIVVFVCILFPQKKNVVKVGPPLANFSGSAHVPNSVPFLTCTYFIIDHMQFVYLLNLWSAHFVIIFKLWILFFQFKYLDFDSTYIFYHSGLLFII